MTTFDASVFRGLNRLKFNFPTEVESHNKHRKHYIILYSFQHLRIKLVLLWSWFESFYRRVSRTLKTITPTIAVVCYIH
jgi:hypothetical protein